MTLVFSVLSLFLQIMMWAIIARAVLSWFDPRAQNPVSRALIELTEPIVAPIRSIMPRMGMLDLSPMVAIFLIYILRSMIASAVTT